METHMFQQPSVTAQLTCSDHYAILLGKEQKRGETLAHRLLCPSESSLSNPSSNMALPWQRKACHEPPLYLRWVSSAPASQVESYPPGKWLLKHHRVFHRFSECQCSCRPHYRRARTRSRAPSPLPQKALGCRCRMSRRLQQKL